MARRLNLTTIFGNPGSTEETLLKDFPADFRYVLTLQEAPAVGMADGYAQATGKAALVNLHTAAGLGNAMGNIESAWYNHAPLVITAGNQVRDMLLLEPFLANAEPTMVPHPYVKWSYEVPRAQDVPATLIRAWAMAVQPLLWPGLPVHPDGRLRPAVPACTGRPRRHHPPGGQRGAARPGGGPAGRGDLTGAGHRRHRR